MTATMTTTELTTDELTDELLDGAELTDAEPEAAPAPTTFNLEQLLRAAAENGTSLQQLTPERVLNLSSEAVQELREGASADPIVAGQLPSDTRRLWSDAGRHVESSARAHVVRLEATGQRAPIRRIVEALQAVADARDISLVIEECSLSEDGALGEPAAPSSELTGAGYLHLLIAPPAHFSGSARIGRRTLVIDPDAPSEGERLVRLRDTVVGQVSENEETVRLFGNPFLTPRQEWSSSNMEQRIEMFESLLAAVLEVRPQPNNSGPTADQQTLRDAVATLDMLPGFVQAIGDRTRIRRQEAEQRLTAQTSTINTLRQQLMDAVRAKADTENEIESLNRAAETVSISRATEALAQVQRIRTRLRAVRHVGLIERGGHPYLDITLHPMVLAHAGQHYLLDKLSFLLQLDADHAAPKWKTIDETGESPHPHVSAGNGNTCWGDAQVHVGTALERKDFVTMIAHVIGWASMYNDSSPYVRLGVSCPFPRTDLPTGWHPELPVNV